MLEDALSILPYFVTITAHASLTLGPGVLRDTKCHAVAASAISCMDRRPRPLHASGMGVLPHIKKLDEALGHFLVRITWKCGAQRNAERVDTAAARKGTRATATTAYRGAFAPC